MLQLVSNIIKIIRQQQNDYRRLIGHGQSTDSKTYIFMSDISLRLKIKTMKIN